jgi:hypothetical protein
MSARNGILAVAATGCALFGAAGVTACSTSAGVRHAASGVRHAAVFPGGHGPPTSAECMKKLGVACYSGRLQRFRRRGPRPRGHLLPSPGRRMARVGPARHRRRRHHPAPEPSRRPDLARHRLERQPQRRRAAAPGGHIVPAGRRRGPVGDLHPPRLPGPGPRDHREPPRRPGHRAQRLARSFLRVLYRRAGSLGLRRGDQRGDAGVRRHRRDRRPVRAQETRPDQPGAVPPQAGPRARDRRRHQRQQHRQLHTERQDLHPAGLPGHARIQSRHRDRHHQRRPLHPRASQGRLNPQPDWSLVLIRPAGIATSAPQIVRHARPELQRTRSPEPSISKPLSQPPLTRILAPARNPGAA